MSYLIGRVTKQEKRQLESFGWKLKPAKKYGMSDTKHKEAVVIQICDSVANIIPQILLPYKEDEHEKNQ